MAEWKCLTESEEQLLRKSGLDPSHMAVNRVGEGHLLFLDMRSRMEVIVTIPDKGNPSFTTYQPEIRPPSRVWTR